MIHLEVKCSSIVHLESFDTLGCNFRISCYGKHIKIMS